MYRPMTAIPVPDVVADEEVVERRQHRARLRATQMAMTAMCGTRLRATRRQSWCPGTARSRENANSIRDADVTDAVRQNSCATQQMKRMNVPQLWPIAATQLVGTM